MYHKEYLKYRTIYCNLKRMLQIGGGNCKNGCGRPAFKHFSTCCQACTGPNGPHTVDCDNRNKPTTTQKNKAIMLQIYDDKGNKTAYHITIAMIKHANPDQVLADVINKFKGYFGSKNRYDLQFANQPWGANSIKTTSKRQSDGKDLDDIRSDIVNYIIQKYGNIIDTSRYKTGLPDQHIDTKGNFNMKGQKWVVTYSIQ